MWPGPVRESKQEFVFVFRQWLNCEGVLHACGGLNCYDKSAFTRRVLQWENHCVKFQYGTIALACICMYDQHWRKFAFSECFLGLFYRPIDLLACDNAVHPLNKVWKSLALRTTVKITLALEDALTGGNIRPIISFQTDGVGGGDVAPSGECKLLPLSDSTSIQRLIDAANAAFHLPQNSQQ